MNSRQPSLKIGWGMVDITPTTPVLVSGQFHARRSEGVMDPITATALAVESVDNRQYAIMVSCDLGATSDDLRDAVRTELKKILPTLDPQHVFLNATHTHTAPEIRIGKASPLGDDIGVKLEVMDPADYIRTAATQIAGAVADAWQNRMPGGIAFGLGQAVIGRNRRIAYYTGEAKMYGNTADPEFSHIEGYEDHSVNLLCTYNVDKKLTGMIVNLACPSQVSENLFVISADYWHETRVELRKRFGKDLFVLPQCSAAGDQSPHVMFNRAAEARILYLKGLIDTIPQKPDSNLNAPMALRKEIALRIADAISTIMPAVEKDINFAPTFAHVVQTVELSRRNLSQADVDSAMDEAAKLKVKYEELCADLDAHPEKKNEPHWYVNITSVYRRMKWFENVAERFARQQRQPKLPIEVHVLRLGEVAIATNPFEYYVDYGVQIKARSPAIQTFVVQLAGNGTYLPTARAVAGKSYGAIPASTPIGPEGGRELVEWTVKTIEKLWEN